MTFDELERRLRVHEDVVIGAGVDEGSVAAAEQALDLVFPPALREYLLRFGHLEVGHFELFGLGAHCPPHLDLVNVTLSERAESGCPLAGELVPLLNDGAGNLYCVGSSGAMVGRVVFWDHVEGPDQQPEEHASSLPTWIAGLVAKVPTQRE